MQLADWFNNKNNRVMKTKVFLSVLALLAATTMINAQTTGNGQRNETCKSSAYVDNNKDGICDNYQNRTTLVSGNKSKGNCDGSRSGKGKGKGKGKGQIFVDANKDGVCDNYKSTTQK
jgi:hypothetical protein